MPCRVNRGWAIDRVLSELIWPDGDASRRRLQQRYGRARCSLGRDDAREEELDFAAQQLRLPRQRAGAVEHLARRLARLAGGPGDAGDVARHLVGALRRLLDVAGDRLGGRSLLLDG